MKVVIVDEHCDTKIAATIKLLEFIRENKQMLNGIEVELCKIPPKRGGPVDHCLIAGQTIIEGEPAIMRFLEDFIGNTASYQEHRHVTLGEGLSGGGLIANGVEDSEESRIKDYWSSRLRDGDDERRDGAPSIETSTAFKASDALEKLASKTEQQPPGYKKQPALPQASVSPQLHIGKPPQGKAFAEQPMIEEEEIDIQAQMVNRFRNDGSD